MHNSNLRIKHFLEESGRQLLYSIRAINYKFMDSLMQAVCVCLSVVYRALITFIVFCATSQDLFVSFSRLHVVS